MTDLAQQIRDLESAWHALDREWEASKVYWEGRNRVSVEKNTYDGIRTDLGEYLQVASDIEKSIDEIERTLDRIQVEHLDRGRRG